jgi:5-methylcytosine-specific restriction endonuclease McrA
VEAVFVSTKRISSKAGFVNTAKLPRGPNGRALCRRCGQEVPKGRRSWCGDGCVHDHRIESDPGYARAQVEKRDAGVCASCGLDCERLRRALSRVEWAKRARFKSLWLGVAGLPATRKFSTCRTLWEMDHTVPVVEGGGACGLDNLRTLCVWCHNRVTAELRGRLAGGS